VPDLCQQPAFAIEDAGAGAGRADIDRNHVISH
jgi:hypothetical protein